MKIHLFRSGIKNLLALVFTLGLIGCGSSGGSGGGSDGNGEPPTSQTQNLLLASCDGEGLPKICFSEPTVQLKMGDDFIPQGIIAVGGDGTDLSAEVVISEISTSAVFPTGSTSNPVVLTHSTVPTNVFYFGTQPRVTFSVTDSDGNVATATQVVKYYNTPEDSPIQKFSGSLSGSVVEWVNGTSRSFPITNKKVTIFFKIEGNDITLMKVPSWSPDIAAKRETALGPDTFIIPDQRTAGVVYGSATVGQLGPEKVFGKMRYLESTNQLIIQELTVGQDTGPTSGGVNTRVEKYAGTLNLVLPQSTEKDPNLIDNDDGTISDTETSLMWVDPGVVKQNRDMSGNWYQAIGVGHDTLNNGTVIRSICGDLDFAGYTDWKVPGRGQLATLLHPFYLGFIDTSLFDYFFTSWSRDSENNQVAWAYQVSFVTGLTTQARRENSRFVLCVRDQ